MKTEAEILKEVPEVLAHVLPAARIAHFQAFASRRRTGHYDLAFDLTLGTTTKRIIGEVKAVGEPRHVLQAIASLGLARKQEAGAYPVVIASYLSRESQRLCRDADVGFVDLTGNVFLQFDNVLIEKSGQAMDKAQRAALRQILSPKSSRILRVLLENPQKIWTLAALAREAGVSLSFFRGIPPGLFTTIPPPWGVPSTSFTTNPDHRSLSMSLQMAGLTIKPHTDML